MLSFDPRMNHPDMYIDALLSTGGGAHHVARATRVALGLAEDVVAVVGYAVHRPAPARVPALEGHERGAAFDAIVVADLEWWKKPQQARNPRIVDRRSINSEREKPQSAEEKSKLSKIRQEYRVAEIRWGTSE